MLHSTVLLLADFLDEHREQLNGLNVFPVPDADTGDNLTALMETVTDLLPSDRPYPDIVDAVARGALLGGRGSSGVIFGQALRGFVTALPETCTGDGLAAALTAAADAAREAVSDPVEGTMITVASDAARRATAAAHGGSAVAVACAAAEEGRRSLARTTDLLPALSEAGVVDAGGLGYVLFLDALAETASGTPRPPLDVTAPAAEAKGVAPSGRYEVMCLVTTDREQTHTLRERWRRIGDTVAIAGGDGTWQCHVHTDDVDAALAAARQAGRVYDVRITDLAEQSASAR